MLYRPVVWGNLWVAMGAAGLAVATCVSLGFEVRWPMVWLLFAATLIVYHADRLLPGGRTTTVDATELSPRRQWLRTHRRVLMVEAAVAGGACLVLLPWVERAAVAVLLPGAMLALLYNVPISLGRRRVVLRELPLLKPLLIAAVWSLATVPAVAVDAGASLVELKVWWVTAERLLFLLAITLPFDLRDLHHDRRAGLVTLPWIVGVDLTRWLSILVLMGFVLLVMVRNGSDLPALLLTAAWTAPLLWLARPTRPEWFFVFLLDGTMVLQAVLLWTWRSLQ